MIKLKSPSDPKLPKSPTVISDKLAGIVPETSTLTLSVGLKPVPRTVISSPIAAEVVLKMTRGEIVAVVVSGVAKLSLESSTEIAPLGSSGIG